MKVAEHPVAPEEVMAMHDGELSPDRLEVVEAHVSQCATCQTVASQVRRISQDLASWNAEGSLHPLRAPTASVHGSVGRGRWWAWRPLPAFALAAGAGTVVVLLAVNAWLNVPPRRQTVAGFAVERAAVKKSERPQPRAAEPDVVQHSEPTDRYLAAKAPEGRILSRSVSPLPVGQAATPSKPPRGPKIIRTANLRIVVADFEAVRPIIDRVLREVGGFIGQMQVSDADTGQLRATLRVPSDRLDDAVRSLKTLGRVVDENQSGDDVTEQVQDLEARLSNSRNTEKRLNDVLRNRTGDVSDVLEVEREMARVREEIERLGCRTPQPGATRDLCDGDAAGERTATSHT